MTSHIPAVSATVLFLAAFAAAAQDINPYPRELIRTEKLHAWTFDKGTDGWRALHACDVSAGKGTLHIECTAHDPYLASPAFRVEPPVAVRLRMKCKGSGPGQIFWATDRSPNIDERKSARFEIMHDGKWHDYEVPLDVKGALTVLRLDPGGDKGQIEVDHVELYRAYHHPLEIVKVETTADEVVAHLKNHSKQPIVFTADGGGGTIPGGATRHVDVRPAGKAPFEAVTLDIASKGLPRIGRTVFVHRPRARGEWATLTSKGLTLRVARDGSGARLLRADRIVAILAPIVHYQSVVPKMKASQSADAIRLRGKGIEVVFTMQGGDVSVSIASARPCEGPVLRVLGPLEQGLLAGLEYLGKGERSSSTLDIETAEHLRYAPDPMKVTMPLMACVTDAAAVAMTWDDMTLQPIYASPNFFDGTPDHKMALRGKTIAAAIAVRPPQPLEELVLWAVKRRGLPPVPKAPRTRAEQWKLCLACLDGPVKGENGWGHCAGKRWKRHPYAAFASTIWRMTGDAPRLPKLAGGGSHVRNDAIYFIQSRVGEWLAMRRGQAQGIIRSQRPDGSWRYKGKFQRGHFEDTASGFCAQRAYPLLEYAWLTGDKEAIAAGVKALDYMKRFRTPRGAQTWELSLHTPDVLASAWLVWAYVRGYEVTGDKTYLTEARRWALSGIPFVYQWSRFPIMLYATPPVFGATHFRAPNWMGLPVQWCGGVYAYALTLFAPYDDTLEWTRLARGILHSGEAQQYPDGKFIGCLPDVFHLQSQTRRPANINPCALVSLRLALDGEVDSLAVATDGKHRVVAPFPVEIRDGKAHIKATKGLAYQILVDGDRIVDIESKGTDIVGLD